jgi:hypothetical protein
MKRVKRWPLADWRSVRVWETDTRLHLRQRHLLWLHGWCIGFTVLGVMWLASHLQMLLGLDSLALRYLLTLGLGYATFLAVLRVWAGWLVGEEPVALDAGDALDLADEGVDLARMAANVARSADLPSLAAGGGDFAGGGADAAFSGVLDGGSSVAGEIAGGALEAVGSLDEGAVVVVPVVVVFLVGLLVLFGAGSLLLLYFGSEVLLAVAVEIAFGYVSARTAIRVVREGWVETAVRLTWKPLLGTLVCAVLLGGLLDHFVPQARSLPHAVKLWRGAQ